MGQQERERRARRDKRANDRVHDRFSESDFDFDADLSSRGRDWRAESWKEELLKQDPETLERRQRDFSLHITDISRNPGSRDAAYKKILRTAYNTEDSLLTIVNITHVLHASMKLCGIDNDDLARFAEDKTVLRLLDLAEQHITHGEGTVRELSSLLLFMGRVKLNHKSIPLYIDRIREDLSSMNTQDITSVMRAFVELDIKEGKLFNDMAERLYLLREEMTVHDIIHMFYASHLHRSMHDKLFRAMDTRLRKFRLDELSSAYASEIIEVYASFRKVLSKDLFLSLLDRVRDHVHDLSAGKIASIFWHQRVFRMYDEDLFRKTSKRALEVLPDFSRKHISGMLWAIGVLRIKDDTFVDKLIEKAMEDIEEATDKNKLALAWGLVVIGAERHHKLARELVLSVDGENLSSFHAARKHKTEVVLGLRDSGDYPVGYSEPMIYKPDPEMNAFEREVYKTLKDVERELNMDLHIEYQQIIDGVHTDFTITFGETKIVIEADGLRFHYINESPKNGLSGKDLFQDKLFHRAHYKVLHIPLPVWRPMTSLHRRAWLGYNLLRLDREAYQKGE